MAREAIELSNTDIRLGSEGLDLIQAGEMREMLGHLLAFLHVATEKIEEGRARAEALEARVASLETWRDLSLWRRLVNFVLRRK